MLKVEYSTLIDKPVEQVWNFLTNFQNTPKWDIGVLETKQTSEGPAGLGTTFQNSGPFLGQTAIREYEVIEYEPHKKVKAKLLTSSRSIQNAEVCYTFEPAQEGTRLTFVGQIEFGGLFKLIQPILYQRAKKDSQGDLENLKRLLEAQTDDV